MSNPIQQAIDGLERIVRWDELSSEFKMNYGSNGERDHFRGVASDALSALQSLQGVELPEPKAYLHEQLGNCMTHAFYWTLRQERHPAKELNEFVPLYTADQLRTAVAAAMARGAAGSAAWENSEGWESLAWELCADENGEESCNELIWEGGPVPEPWGERWLKYEDEAKRLIALVQKHVRPATHAPEATQPTQAEAPSEREALRELVSAYADHRDASGAWGNGQREEILKTERRFVMALASARAALATQQAGPDSYESIWNALQRIDSVAAMLPTYTVDHEGDIEAFTQNIVDAITRLHQQPEALAQQGLDREDAENYRWLLARSRFVHNRAWLGNFSTKRMSCDFFSPDEARQALDTAIRAARSSEGGSNV